MKFGTQRRGEDALELSNRAWQAIFQKKVFSAAPREIRHAETRRGCFGVIELSWQAIFRMKELSATPREFGTRRREGDALLGLSKRAWQTIFRKDVFSAALREIRHAEARRGRFGVYR